MAGTKDASPSIVMADNVDYVKSIIGLFAKYVNSPPRVVH